MDIFNYLMNKKGKNLFYNKKSLSYLLGKNAPHYLSGTYIEIDGKNVKIQKLEMTKESTQDGTPTPENPVEVKTVKGYRNLFDKNGTLSNGYLKVDGTVQSANGFKVSDYIDISGFSNITISGNAGGSEINSFYDENKTFISSNGMSTNTSKTISVPSNAKYLRCTINDNNLSQYQVVDGNSVLPYIPYGTNWVYTKICGKNLLDLIIKNQVNSSVSSDNITITDSSNWGQSYIIFDDKITPGQYTLSLLNNTNNIRVLISGYKNGALYTNVITTEGLYNPVYSSYYQATAYNGISSNATFTLPDTCDYYFIGFALPTTGNETFKAQLERGTIETQYEAYKESIITIPLNNNEICGIGDYLDEIIVDKNGHCWLNKKIGKVVLNGSENVQAVNTNTSGNYRFYIAINDYTIIHEDVSIKSGLLCNKLVETTRNENYARVQGICYVGSAEGNRLSVYTDDTKEMTSTQFKEWLSNNNLIVYPILAEENLIDLNYNVDLTLYEGINNITNSEDMDMNLIYHY